MFPTPVYFVPNWGIPMHIQNNFEITETRNTLILDLDSTLIYSVPVEELSRYSWAVRADCLRLTYRNRTSLIILKRPGLDEFLERVARMFHLAVYTAAASTYCDAVVQWIDNGRGVLSERYSRDSCVKIDGYLTKDITIVRRDLSKVAILDDNEIAYRFFKENAIRIQPWFGDFYDRELPRVFEILKQLEHCDDVRVVLATQNNYPFMF